MDITPLEIVLIVLTWLGGSFIAGFIEAHREIKSGKWHLN